MRADRATLGLALAALVTAGALVTGEFARLARRRRESGEVPTPETLVGTAEMATRDTIAVARTGLRATPHHETVMFNMLQGFLGGFALARISTWGIKSGWWPTGNVSVGGRHIHHFVPGIALAFGSAGVGLATKSEGVEAALAIPFGAGVGLTLDEAALLLDLEDVYWTREGLLSVQVSLGITALLAASILALRVLRRGEERGEREGLIPQTEEFGTAAVGALA
ncbi:MAG: hypothetical protein EXQ70_05710 [Solirubrobacterales bacterium]|nr:hypothetical protein [Solirubrobacterales bacterium]